MLIECTSVLIETLWNVNIFAEAIEELKDLGINRNIVECKFPRAPVLHILSVVLIETLWNVNAKTNLIMTNDIQY